MPISGKIRDTICNVILIVFVLAIVEGVVWGFFGPRGAVLALIVIVLLVGACVGPTAHCGS